MEVCSIKKQLVDMVIQHRIVINQVMKFAKILNFNIDSLECQKINIDEVKKDNQMCQFMTQAEKDYVRFSIYLQFTL